jgi:hypothetical protein
LQAAECHLPSQLRLSPAPAGPAAGPAGRRIVPSSAYRAGSCEAGADRPRAERLLPRQEQKAATPPLPRRLHMLVKISRNDKGNPPGKLADAELHFVEGALDGLKLIGFTIWERRNGGGRNVTFPARQYSVNGERRSFALLRPLADGGAQDKLRDLILHAYEEHEAQVAMAE